LHKPDTSPLLTREGPANVESCISYLCSIRPVPALRWSDSLYLAAQAHLNDIGPAGRLGHDSADGRSAEDRISAFCRWSGAIGENIAYGCTDAEEIVTSLLIDDGVLARGQRLNIMKRDHCFVGIAVGPHKEYEYACVMVFAEEVFDEGQKRINCEDIVEISRKSREGIRKMKTIDGFEYFDVRNYEKQGLSCKKILEFKEIFDFLDNESEGVIDPSEVRTIFEEGEVEVSDLSAFMKVAEMDFGGKKLGFDEFLEKMTEQSSVSMTLSRSEIQNSTSLKFPLPKSLPKKDDTLDISNAVFKPDEIIEIKEYFDKIDSSSSGFIDSEALKSFIEIKGLEGSNSDILQLLTEFSPADVASLGFPDLVERLADLKAQSSKPLPPPAVAAAARPVRKPIKKTSFSKSAFDPRRFVSEALPLEAVLELKQAFDTFDTAKSGTINPHDLKQAMEKQGFSARSPTLFAMISSLPDEDIASVDFESFIKMLTDERPDSSLAEFRRMFNIFDVERKGYIELEQVRKIAREVGETLNEKQLIELFVKSDLDGDGKVSFQDFYNVMNLRVYIR
jgi:Ca2+-binding EF-hand superfamily protein